MVERTCLERVVDDVEFDGILSPDFMVHFADIGRHREHDGRDDDQEGTQDRTQAD